MTVCGDFWSSDADFGLLMLSCHRMTQSLTLRMRSLNRLTPSLKRLMHSCRPVDADFSGADALLGSV